jgi:hypothetical protein
MESREEIREERELVTRTSAKTMARFMFNNNPSWSEEMLNSWVNKLRLKSPIIPSLYRQVFTETYIKLQTELRINLGGNQLPPEEI